MNLNNIVVVLSRPEESRNIGAVCRAMANSGIKNLRIVCDPATIDVERVHILAIHAAYIFDNATFYSSITEATSDCVTVAGTTRRRGKKRKGKLLLPEEFADLASRLTGKESRKDDGGKVAVVFGNERTGLTDEEVEECNMGVTIPSCHEFASLNLSHAVQVICYHLFRNTQKDKTGYTPIDRKRLDQTVTEIADDLQKIGFFKVTGRKDMEHFWKGILSRAALSEREAQYLEQVFSKAAGLASKNSQ